jgi:hypothetical protein
MRMIKRIFSQGETLMKSVLTAGALVIFLCSPSLAQTIGQANSSQMDAASANNDKKGPGDSAEKNDQTQQPNAVQKIRQDLQTAGFTDVKIVARSFVVQARTRDGNPVVMTIGPHGMSAFEAMSAPGQNSGTVGVSPGSAGTSNSSESNAPAPTGQSGGSSNVSGTGPQQ